MTWWSMAAQDVPPGAGQHLRALATHSGCRTTYETFAEAARKPFSGSLKGKFLLTAGLGGMGGAQPLAITMNEGVCLAIEVDPNRIQRRLETGYCDTMASTLDEALHQIREACEQGEALSIG